jgi:hypothetical protein
MEQGPFLRNCAGLPVAGLLFGSLISLLPAADPAGSAPQPLPGVTPRQFHQQAAARYAGFRSYIARFVRRDPATGEEILAFYFRKQPWSVRFRWLSGAGQGREVLYVQGRYEDKLHVILAPGDVPLLPGGHMMSFALDSPMVKQASRTPITQSGIGAMIDRFGQALDAQERGDFSYGRTTVLGLEHRPDYDAPLIFTEQRLPPSTDPDVPRGGRRLIGFHAEEHLPVMAILYDEHDKEVDYYRFDRLQLGVELDDRDFDPVRMAQRYKRTGAANQGK